MTLRLAQVLLALVFVFGGLATLRAPQRPAQQLSRLRLPFPTFFVRLNAAVMVVAGLALALNTRAAVASTVLVAMLVPTTLLDMLFGTLRAPPASSSWPISSRTWPFWVA
jgi:uncharacterized membrane protein YphA (DoxX/SURF4 family)